MNETAPIRVDESDRESGHRVTGIEAERAVTLPVHNRGQTRGQRGAGARARAGPGPGPWPGSGRLAAGGGRSRLGRPWRLMARKSGTFRAIIIN